LRPTCTSACTTSKEKVRVVEFLKYAGCTRFRKGAVITNLTLTGDIATVKTTDTADGFQAPFVTNFQLAVEGAFNRLSSNSQSQTYETYFDRVNIEFISVVAGSINHTIVVKFAIAPRSSQGGKPINTSTIISTDVRGIVVMAGYYTYKGTKPILAADVGAPRAAAPAGGAVPAVVKSVAAAAAASSPAPPPPPPPTPPTPSPPPTSSSPPSPPPTKPPTTPLPPAKSVVASVKLSTDIATIPAGSGASFTDWLCHRPILLSLNCECR
jgi:hypothetical protein